MNSNVSDEEVYIPPKQKKRKLREKQQSDCESDNGEYVAPPKRKKHTKPQHIFDDGILPEPQQSHDFWSICPKQIPRKRESPSEELDFNQMFRKPPRKKAKTSGLLPIIVPPPLFENV